MKLTHQSNRYYRLCVHRAQIVINNVGVWIQSNVEKKTSKINFSTNDDT